MGREISGSRRESGEGFEACKIENVGKEMMGKRTEEEVMHNMWMTGSHTALQREHEERTEISISSSLSLWCSGTLRNSSAIQRTAMCVCVRAYVRALTRAGCAEIGLLNVRVSASA